MDTNQKRELRNSRKAGLRCVGAFSRTKRNRVRKRTAVAISRCDRRGFTRPRWKTTKEVFTQSACFPGNGPVVDLVMHAPSRSTSETAKTFASKTTSAIRTAT